MEKARLDLLLLEIGLASTRTKAQDLIRNGDVIVDGKIVRHPGEKFSKNSRIELTASEHPFVSRGGVKLEAALENFSINLNGKRALDVGQSTGGFTHCMLLRGVMEVVGVEVGNEQLAPILRADPRVKVIEKQDIRFLDLSTLSGGFDFFVVDVSFISLLHILPAIPPFLGKTAEGILLVKPQFEVGPAAVGSGGIVRNVKMREWANKRVSEASSSIGFTVTGELPSPITGGDGNQETLLHLVWTSS